MRPTKREIAHRLRQLMKQARENRRELTLQPKFQDDQSCLDSSGAIRLTIADILPTVDNSLGLPPGMELETGLKGNDIWPVSVDDVSVEEEDEVGELSDQQLGFSHVMCENPVRTAITVEVSNMAIDAAGFDLLSFVRQKFAIAQRKYIASRLFSNAEFDGNNGPFSADHFTEWSVPSAGFYSAIMARMTALEEAGFDTADACIVMDFDMECLLKVTPIVPNEGRMVIQDGLCCGYQYVVNKYFNTELNAQGELVKKDCDAIGIAVFKWFKIAQHGTARLIIDGTSADAASRNVTAITLNTAWSFTDLSQKINGHDEMQAFHTLIMTRGYLADNSDHIFETSDGYLLQVGMSSYDMNLADVNNIILTADGQPLVVDPDRT